jgi:uroporphyrinogen-III decarboxylase
MKSPTGLLSIRYLTGLSKFLTDLLIEPPYLKTMLDIVMQINLDLGRQLVYPGVDIIWIGNDFGSQTGMAL